MGLQWTKSEERFQGVTKERRRTCIVAKWKKTEGQEMKTDEEEGRRQGRKTEENETKTGNEGGRKHERNGGTHISNNACNGKPTLTALCARLLFPIRSSCRKSTRH